MCFLSCSLDSPPARSVPVLGTLSAGSTGRREVGASALPPRPLSHRALQGQLWGDTDPAPPCPTALTPTSVSSWRTCRLPQKSPLAGKRRQNTAHFGSSGPSGLCLPPRSRGVPGQAVSPPRCRRLPGEGPSPGAGAGTSVGPALISRLAALSPRCAERRAALPPAPPPIAGRCCCYRNTQVLTFSSFFLSLLSFSL